MKIKWQRVWARKYGPYLGFVTVQSFNRKTPFGSTRNKLFIPEGNLYATYFSEQEIQDFAKRYAAFLRKQNLAQYARWFEGQYALFLAWTKRAARINFSKLTTSQFINFFNELTKRMIVLQDFNWYAFFISITLTKDIEQALAKRAKAAELLQAIGYPYKITKITKARLELSKLAQKKKASGNNLAEYAKRYAWLPVYEFIDKPWDVEDFAEQVKLIKNPIKELEDFYKARRRNFRVYRTFLKTIRDKRFKKDIEIVHYFGYLKEMRDDYRRHGYYLLTPFWQELARRTNLSFIETGYLLPDEIRNLIKTGKPAYKKLAKARIGKFALHLKNGKTKIYTGDKADKVIKLVAGNIKSKDPRGMSACPGIVRGKVKIIYHQGEFKKFKSGEILVTPMTHPEFLPIMKRAKAIVTDEGGVTCHAAIVSRELKIPCVIGTKIATKVFKDGDLIEVDATKGIIKKVN